MKTIAEIRDLIRQIPPAFDHPLFGVVIALCEHLEAVETKLDKVTQAAYKTFRAVETMERKPLSTEREMISEERGEMISEEREETVSTPSAAATALAKLPEDQLNAAMDALGARLEAEKAIAAAHHAASVAVGTSEKSHETPHSKKGKGKPNNGQ